MNSKTRMPASAILLNIVLAILTIKKEIKGIQIRKGKLKLSLFIDIKMLKNPQKNCWR